MKSVETIAYEASVKKIVKSVIALSAVLLIAAAILLKRHWTPVTASVFGGALVALCGTIIAAVVSYLVAVYQIEQQALNARKTQCENLTFDLHKDFSSDDMLRARGEADELTARHIGVTYHELYVSLPSKQTDCLFKVTDFYDRLATAIEHNRVEKNITVDLFGSIFIWWWTTSLEEQVCLSNPEWDMSTRLRFLHKFLKEHATPEQWQTWNTAADTAKTNRLKGSYFHYQSQ